MKKSNNFTLLYERLTYYINLIKRFIKLKPKCSMAIVILSITTQVLMLLSFIMPLKMLLIIGIGEFKGLSLKFYTITSKEELAVFFSIGMVFLLGSLFTIEKFSSFTKKRCSSDIWTTSKYFQVYENQETIANKIFNQYTSSLSGLFFIFLILLVLSILYIKVLLVFVIYWFLVLILFIVLSNNSIKLQKKVESELGKVINTLGMLSFLVVFVVVILDFISTEPSVTLIHAVISLILIRHMMGSITSTIQAVKNLYNQQNQIETIFFNGYINHQQIDKKQKKFWDIFKDERYKKFISNSMNEILKRDTLIKEFIWYELEQPNVVAFLLTIENNEQYLIKIFNKNLHARVLKENVLLSGCCNSELTIPFIGIGMIEEYYCHYYRYENYNRTLKKDFEEYKIKFLEKLLCYEVPQPIIKQYITSHKYIYERFSEELFDRLKLAANNKEKILLDWFEKEIDSIFKSIQKLPLRLVLPAINKNILVKDQDEDIKIFSFDNWMIEPIGYGFNPNQKEKELLKSSLNEEEYILAQIVQSLKAYEHNTNRNNLKQAIQNINAIKSLKSELK